MTKNALANRRAATISALDAIKTELYRNQRMVSALLPAGITPDRFRAMVVGSVMKTPKLLECSTASVLKAALEAAKLGLAPDTPSQLCTLVPYKGTAQFQLMFRGVLALLYRSDAVTSVWADLVYEGDTFDEIRGSEPKLVHVPAPLDQRDANRKKLAAYACARLTNDPVTQFVVVDAAYIARVRAAAQTANVWNTWPEAMWKKTAIKQLGKVLPLPDEVRAALNLDSQGEVGEQASTISLDSEPAIEPAIEQPAPGEEDAPPADVETVYQAQADVAP